MKKIKLLLFAVFMLVALFAQSQVSINVNLGTPPVWAPADRAEVQYYYLPDIDSYYDVPSAQFIYIKNGKWFRSSNLPYRYRNYNLRGANVQYLNDYRGRSPYKYHQQHLMKYRQNYHPEMNHNDNHGLEHHDNGNHGNENHGLEHHDNGNHGNENHGLEHHDNENHGNDHDHHDNGNHRNEHHDNGNNGNDNHDDDHQKDHDHDKKD